MRDHVGGCWHAVNLKTLQAAESFVSRIAQETAAALLHVVAQNWSIHLNLQDDTIAMVIASHGTYEQG